MTKELQLYWSDTQLALPSDIKIKRKFIGRTSIMADGSIKVDATDPAQLTRRNLEIEWGGLSQTEYDTLSTAFTSYATESTPLKFQEYDDEAHTTKMVWLIDVIAIAGGWEESVWYDSSKVAYYDVKLKFTEPLT